MGAPVARSDVVPWAPRLENVKVESSARVEPTAARVWLKLVSCKSLGECCAARSDRRPERAPGHRGVGQCVGIENSNGGSPMPTRVEPTAARILPKLVSFKSLSECCAGPK